MGDLLGQIGGALLGSNPVTTLAGAAVPILGNLLGGQEQVEYRPTYGDIYSYDPYSWASGERETYQQGLEDMYKGQMRQEGAQRQRYGEDINRRGLGASSIYGSGLANIASSYQKNLQSQNVQRMEALQRDREQRAAQQRAMKHAWNLGPGVGGQAQQYEANAARQQGLMGQIAQNLGSGYRQNQQQPNPSGGNVGSYGAPGYGGTRGY